MEWSVPLYRLWHTEAGSTTALGLPAARGDVWLCHYPRWLTPRQRVDFTVAVIGTRLRGSHATHGAGTGMERVTRDRR